MCVQKEVWIKLMCIKITKMYKAESERFYILIGGEQREGSSNIRNGFLLASDLDLIKRMIA